MERDFQTKEEQDKKANAEACRRYYARNREAIRARRALSAEANKVTAAKYYARNKGRIGKRMAQWRKDNTPKIAQYGAERRALATSQTPIDCDKIQVSKIYAGCPDGYHVDHWIPLNKGGLHHQDNLVYLTAHHNMQKKDMLPQDWFNYRLNRFGIDEMIPEYLLTS